MATSGLEVIMEDDMQPGFPPIQHSDLRTLIELSKYRIDRQKAELWAHRHIKFLVYDDTDLQENGYDSDDEEGMVEYAMMISGDSEPTNEDEGKDTGEKEIEDWDEEVILGRTTSSKASDDEDSVLEDTEGSHDEPECDFCLSVPEFPRDFKPRKFRLVQAKCIAADPDEFKPGGPYVCSHYVAVSYCWPVPELDEQRRPIMTPGTYKVRDLDGVVRTSRALDNVLDPAVNFATACGFLLKNIRMSRSFGVQAMDVVYNRASITAGLLSTPIIIQEQIDAIATLRAFSLIDSGTDAGWEGIGEAPPGDEITPILNHVLDFLENVSADRWYTRAWIAQEGLSAGEMLILLFPLTVGLSYVDLLEDGEPEDNPYIAQVPPRNGVQSSTIGISVKGFQHLVRVAKCLFYIVYRRPGAAVHPRAWSIIQKVEALHPIAPQPNILSERMFIPGGNNYRPRQTTDAAGALTLLRTRGCRDVQDRIAIVANMCNFENRLNTYLLGRHCKSLRLGLIALTVLNGDYSLLIPEAYALRPLEDRSQENENGMGWLWPLNMAPDDFQLNYYKLRHEGFLSSSLYNFGQAFTLDGPRLDANIWTVEDIFDFGDIQREWSEKWSNLKALKIFVKARDGETTEDAQERQRVVVQTICDDMQVLRQVRAVALPAPHVFEAGTGYGDVEFEASVTTLPSIGDPEIVRGIAEIVFAILRHLYLNSHSNQKAIGLANSIWHSLRVDAVSTDADEFPDDIGDWLFSHSDIDNDPSVLLQLDETSDESFGQAWFIECIMRDGYLWIGRYLIPDSINNLASDSSKGKELAYQASNSPASDSDENETIASRQMQRKMIASMAIITGPGKEDSNRADGAIMNMDRRNLVSFVGAVSKKSSEKEQHEACARELVSAFDVDGPCLIAIPRNNDLEVLPRPPLRSMAVCWVVEPVVRAKLKREEHQDEISDNSSATNVLLPDQRPVAEDKAEGSGSSNQHEISSSVTFTSSESLASLQDNERYLTQSEEDSETLYRVINKVRGLWQIREYPIYRYQFM